MELKGLSILKKVIWLRLAQIFVNERYKDGDFVIPIHLAMGHESIAVAVDATMKKEDSIFLTHRNIHYNLARNGSLKQVLDEYYLKPTGMAKGRLGSMNLSNPDKNIIYSSSILGNNLAVGCGFALGNKVKNSKGVVFIDTGDGAIEEGSFYESLLFLKSNNLPSVIIVENNGWSLGTKIAERRADIDLCKFTDSLNIEYILLESNDPFEYINKLSLIRDDAFCNKTVILVEVKLTTLGYWYQDHEDYPDGKFINYHAGPAPQVNESVYPIIDASNDDPLQVLANNNSLEDLEIISSELQKELRFELL